MNKSKAIIVDTLYAYEFRCGTCQKTWIDIWGSADDITGEDPYNGMDVECKHCKAELELEMAEEGF